MAIQEKVNCSCMSPVQALAQPSSICLVKKRGGHIKDGTKTELLVCSNGGAVFEVCGIKLFCL